MAAMHVLHASNSNTGCPLTNSINKASTHPSLVDGAAGAGCDILWGGRSYSSSILFQSSCSKVATSENVDTPRAGVCTLCVILSSDLSPLYSYKQTRGFLGRCPEILYGSKPQNLVALIDPWFKREVLRCTFHPQELQEDVSFSKFSERALRPTIPKIAKGLGCIDHPRPLVTPWISLHGFAVASMQAFGDHDPCIVLVRSSAVLPGPSEEYDHVTTPNGSCRRDPELSPGAYLCVRPCPSLQPHHSCFGGVFDVDAVRVRRRHMAHVLQRDCRCALACHVAQRNAHDDRVDVRFLDGICFGAIEDGRFPRCPRMGYPRGDRSSPDQAFPFEAGHDRKRSLSRPGQVPGSNHPF
eukprot:scaffold436_cov336-Pavlova_lutheri.AAC.16